MEELREMLRNITLIDNPQQLEQNEIIIDNSSSSEEEPAIPFVNPVEGEGTSRQQEIIDQKPTIKIDDSYNNKRGYFRSETGKFENTNNLNQN